MSTPKPLQIDIVSDVVCPWCYIGKRRIENALALTPDVPVEINWRPFFLNPWVPREGIGRDEYLTAKFGSVEAYTNIAGRVVTAAGEEGLSYRPDLVRRQPNTIDCHRLIHWADASGKSAAMKQRLMELYFRDGGDLTDTDVLVRGRGRCRARCLRRAPAAGHRRGCRADLGAGQGCRRQGHLRRADVRVRAEIRSVRRPARRTTRPRHPRGLGRGQRAGGRVGRGVTLELVGRLRDNLVWRLIMKIKIVVHEAEAHAESA